MTVTSTIGTSSRNYSTLAGWSASIPSTLTDNIVGLAYKDSEFLNDVVNLQGHTTGSYTITLTAAAGQSFADAPTAALGPYSAAAGVAIRNTNGYTNTINCNDSGVTLSRLQIRNEANSKGGILVFNGSNASYTLDSCLVWGGSSGSVGINIGQGTLTMVNCLGLFNSGVTTAINISYSRSTFHNNTLVFPSDGTTKPNGFRQGASGYLSNFVNNAVFGFASALNSAPDTNSKNNYTDQASPPASFTKISFAGPFKSTTTASPDFRLASGSALIDAGTTSSLTSKDLYGTSRPQGAAYDVGAVEAAVARGRPTITIGAMF